jgi:hypothetical protein
MSEFYVGYLPKAPSDIARRARSFALLLLAMAVAGAIVFAASQRTFAPAAFEFGQERSFEGFVSTIPYPALLVRRPGAGPQQAGYSYYSLVAPGKHGADALAAQFEGQAVRLRGILIYRDDQTMIEIVPGSIAALPSDNHVAEPLQDLGTFTLTGEIVDSKCNFGVMNPGRGKVHKDCAVRCLSGGIPPAFVTDNFAGRPATLLLIGPGRTPFAKAAFLQRVAQPLQVQGKVVKDGDQLFFEVEPAALIVQP